jgi:hypothetical protein
MTDVAKGFSDFDPLASVKKEVDSFTSDPLGTTPSAGASPEAPAPGVAAPMSSDATIPPTPSTEAPQPETKTETASDTKSGTTPGSGA